MVTALQFILFATLAAYMTNIPASASATDLSPYQWENRLLLSFGPTLDDPNMVVQRTKVSNRQPGFLDRDLVLIEVPEDDTVVVDGQPSETLDAAALRERFDVAPGQYRAILVGLDGGQKSRQTAPITMDRLYENIDRMPMRQQELRQQGKLSSSTR